MKKTLILIFVLLVFSAALADVSVTVNGGRSGITSNTVIDIKHNSSSIWLGTGTGAAVSTDGGNTWTTYGAGSIPSDEVSALAANELGVWVGASHSQVAQGETYPYGDGIALTRNGGATWQTFTPEQAHFFGKIAYDLSAYDSIAYAACFYGGLIRTLDYGHTWKNLFPTQLDSVNSDSADYATATYASYSNRLFAVKTDTLDFPDTFSVWGGSAAGIYRFLFTTDFYDDFINGLGKWKKFGYPVSVDFDTTQIHGRIGILDNMGDSTCNSGVISKKLFGGPGGFSMQTDIYLELRDSLGCWAEGGIAFPKDANPGWSDDCSDTASNAYGLYFSLAYVGEACPDPRVPPQARHHAWFIARYLDENDSLETFNPYSDSSADRYINSWNTLKVDVSSDDTIKFLVISGADTIPIWTGPKKLSPSLMTGRNIVLGFRSSGNAGKVYHDVVRGNQTGPRTYPTYPDSIAHYFFSSADSTIADSLKLPGNHVVSLGLTKIGSQKMVWAACRPVDSGENRRIAYSTDDGVTWHTAPITGPGSDAAVEGWDYGFSVDTVYAATSFGLFRSTGDLSSWAMQTGFKDLQNQTFYQDNAPFYAVDINDGAIWAGGADGTVKSIPNGWRVFRSQLDPNDYYAYPSPFSPNVSTRHGTTIHFKPTQATNATVKIYDFNLDLVKTVAENLPRAANVESDDIIWDGANEDGKTVANGVYFFRIQLDYGNDLWGKVVVIR
jgi:hypothetical protein